MKEELQEYLNNTYPGVKIDTPYSIGGKFYIRFALGKGWPNGSMERVNQATERAMTILDKTFQTPDTDLYVLAYEYPDDFSDHISGYLHSQINVVNSGFFYKQKEFIQDRFIVTDEKMEVTLSIYKAGKKDINFENIIRGISNKEMGFKPKIYEEIYFFDRNKNIIFNMYDDRGCLVWGNSSDEIRSIYETYNTWIVEYDRIEIDKQFLD